MVGYRLRGQQQEKDWAARGEKCRALLLAQPTRLRVPQELDQTRPFWMTYNLTHLDGCVEG